MCIIAVKQSGQELMSKEIFRTMAENNPHGNGFMYNEDGQVVISKGYMDFESYYNEILEIPNPTEKTIVFHLRISTHGQVNRYNCHPFPLSSKIKHLRKTEFTTRVGIVHNGVIPIEPKGDWSDTMEYIKTSLVKHYATDENFHLKEANRQLIKSEIKSKMAILTGDGHVEMIGDFNESDGIYYSNYSYVPYEPTVFTYRKKPTQIEEFVAYGKSEFEDLSTYGYNDDSLFGNQLEYDEYTIMDGMKIYGDEAEIYLTDRGVYAFMDDTYEPYKIGDVAYDREDREIKFIETPYTIFLW